MVERTFVGRRGPSKERPRRTRLDSQSELSISTELSLQYQHVKSGSISGYIQFPLRQRRKGRVGFTYSLCKEHDIELMNPIIAAYCVVTEP